MEGSDNIGKAVTWKTEYIPFCTKKIRTNKWEPQESRDEKSQLRYNAIDYLAKGTTTPLVMARECFVWDTVKVPTMLELLTQTFKIVLILNISFYVNSTLLVATQNITSCTVKEANFIFFFIF